MITQFFHSLAKRTAFYCLMTTLSAHTAAGQALGYFFQLDRALTHIAKAPTGSFIGIETEDDIVVKMVNGEKIHEQDKSSVTVYPFIPSKPDLWKTLCIWADGILSEEINVDLTIFLLVTNKTSANCLAKTISEAKDDTTIDACLESLKAYVDSSNEVTKPFIDKLFSFGDDLLKKLIKRTTLITGDSLIGDALTQELISLFQIVDGEDSDKISIINEIYGWLINSVKAFWQKKEPAWIERDAVIRLKNKILDSRKEKFLNEKVFDVKEISEGEKAIQKKSMYVKQLRIIKNSDTEIISAISDYLNSGEKRTLLAKRGYVTGFQMDEMIEELQIRWVTIAKKNRLAYKSLNEEELGQMICNDTLDHNARIGEMETRGYFLTRGCYHEMANSLSVGWHPDYLTLLKEDKNK